VGGQVGRLGSGRDCLDGLWRQQGERQQPADVAIFDPFATKSKAEKPKPPKPVNVRVKAPPGLGAVQTLSGRRITIAEDRIVEMSAEDANCLPSSWTLLTE
jgi:hypothetical protein